MRSVLGEACIHLHLHLLAGASDSVHVSNVDMNVDSTGAYRRLADTVHGMNE